MTFEDTVSGLQAGDFSRLAPLFERTLNGDTCPIVNWHKAGRFDGHAAAAAEAFTCACFNGCVDVAEYFLMRGMDPSGGAGTGLNAFHWAVNRGHLSITKLLIRHRAPLETKNAYGGTVLGCAVYSAVHEQRPDHLPIILDLLDSGADVDAAAFPSGDADVDEVLRAYRARRA
ncbi:MAG: ankyrin repeat domain-containing protein [Burkholderiales bacterium]|nr:ankyrin repeat domain-containing protein [Phycisphaerae bacterium]